MKKKLITALLVTGLVAGLMVGCGRSNDSTTGGADAGTEEDASGGSEDSAAIDNAVTEEDVSNDETENAAGEVVKVGAVPTPHAEVLELIKEDLAAAGYELEIVEYNDYILPNVALDAGDLDANYFQHLPYLDDYNAENGTALVGVAAVHYEPMGIYAGKTASLEELEDGAQVAVPNDSTNEARALLLLEQEGLIKLDENAGIQATVNDIVENPLNLKITELEAALAAKSLQDVDIAVLNANYAIEEGVMDKQLAVEAADSLAADTYANYVVVREGDEENAKIKALVDAILSDKVREYINATYEGAVLPVF